MAGQLASFQIAIYLVQEALERLEAGIAPHALLDGRLLVTGVVVQSAIALLLAVLVTLAGRAAEAVGRALRRVTRPPGSGPACRRCWTWWLAGRAGCWPPGWAAAPHPAPWSFADATANVGGAGARAATLTTEEFP